MASGIWRGAAIGTSTAAALVLLLSSASAAPGDLDPSFGSDGYVTTSVGQYGGSPAAVVLQPDGKIVVGGSDWNVLALVRYLPDGSLDPGFGSAGIVTGPPGYGNALALQPDGKLLLAGSRDSGSFAVVRYLPNGSIDTGFGTNGTVTGRGGAAGIAVQPDGRIVVVGGVRDPSGPGALAVARFNADGSRDVSFGTDGVVTTHIGPSSAASAVSIQQDGKILVAGMSASIYSDYEASVVLARYSADGTLDPGFGTAGTLTTPLQTSLYAGSRLALQADGRILAVGSLGSIGMARYLPDGSPDTSFGTQGIVSVPGAGASGIVVQQDGRIVVGGTAGYGLAAMRFEARTVRSTPGSETPESRRRPSAGKASEKESPSSPTVGSSSAGSRTAPAGASQPHASSSRLRAPSPRGRSKSTTAGPFSSPGR